MPPAPKVVIVGGGLAGLAAASSLVGLDLEITVLESRPRLGGRASSFPDPVTGEAVDNCQHVSMGCCTNLADFCRRVGIADSFRRVETLHFLGPDGRISTLGAGRWPAPFHLFPALLNASYLTRSERFRVAYGLARLARLRRPRLGQTVADWLLDHRQTVRTLGLFWSPVLVSALNERLDRMDVGHARKVIVDAFCRNREGYVLHVPTIPLGDLYGRRLETWLAEGGVRVRLTTGARRIEIDDDRCVQGVTLRTGETVPADFVIAAVPFDRFPNLLPESATRRFIGLENVGCLEPSPITGIHVWFDREVCPYEHVVPVGRTIQWVFNHTALQGRGLPGAEGTGGQYLQLVVSAAYDLLHLNKEEIRDLALEELATLWPATREARLVRWWVVTEHGATFSVRPDVDRLRPSQRVPIEGLFVAGDWTATGWPATMEGAVRSGYLAAEGVLQDLGLPRRLLRPDLPTEPLARLWLGRPAVS